MSETQALAPVSVSERLEEVDLLRGWALLGILLVNMNFFAWPLFTIFLWGSRCAARRPNCGVTGSATIA